MQAVDTAFALSATGLCKRYGPVTALDGLSLGIAEGEIYGLLGANGAGKTTALRIVSGLLQPDSGDGECLGRRLGTRIPQLGYMAQRGGLYDDLSIRENLMFFARAHGLPAAVCADAALDRHGLSERGGQRVGVLSGGWRQRVALAAALLHAPRLLLLDEPSAGLDPQARESLWDHLRALTADGRTSLLVTTHYADEAERCDRIGYLDAGRLRVEGPPDRLSAALGLQRWQLPAAARPPLDAGVCCLRDAAGWRLIAAESAIHGALKSWLAQSGAVPAPARLSDALSWLAVAPDAGA